MQQLADAAYIPAYAEKLTVANWLMSSIDHFTPAPTTSECCQCHIHNRFRVRSFTAGCSDCGTIYHLYSDGQTWHVLFWNRRHTCLVVLIAKTAAHSDSSVFNAFYKYSMYVCILDPYPVQFYYTSFISLIKVHNAVSQFRVILSRTDC